MTQYVTAPHNIQQLQQATIRCPKLVQLAGDENTMIVLPLDSRDKQRYAYIVPTEIAQDLYDIFYNEWVINRPMDGIAKLELLGYRGSFHFASLMAFDD